MTPEQVRAAVDARFPRVHDDGSINVAHVAAEQTLRTRYRHPGFIAELDGPGRFRPRLRPEGLSLHALATVADAVDALLDAGMTRDDVGDALGVEQAWVEDLADDRDARLARPRPSCHGTGPASYGCPDHAP